MSKKKIPKGTKHKEEKIVPVYENFHQSVKSEEDLEMIEDALEMGAISRDELTDLIL